jgi:hypothetical protein
MFSSCKLLMNILGLREILLLKVALNPKIFIKSLQEEDILLKVALSPKIFIKSLQEEKLLLKVALNPKIFIKVFLPVSF